MEKLYTSKTLLKMANGRMYIPGPHPTHWICPWPCDTEIIERVWHILDTSHHQFCSFLLKGRVKKGGMAQCPPS